MAFPKNLLLILLCLLLAIFLFRPYIEETGKFILGMLALKKAGIACSDSDNGNSIYVQGTCSSSKTSVTDFCNADGTLTEYYCSKGQKNSQCTASTVTCPSGYSCSNGACLVSTATTTTTIPSTACNSIKFSGDSSKKLDIVFVGDKYQDLATFDNDTEIHTNTLFSIEPFASNTSRINVWRVDSLSDLGCYYNCAGIDRLICCDSSKVAYAASQCPNDEIIVLVNNGTYGGSGGSFAVASRFFPAVTVHEFGHSFGGLYDEYLAYNSPSGTSPNGPNCGDSNCSSWSDLFNTSCVQGCTYTNWYRPSACSLMYALNCFYFNSPSIRQISNLLGYYSPFTPAPMPPPNEVDILTFNYNYGTITLKNISVKAGFAPDKKTPAVGLFKLKTLSKSKNVLQSILVDPPVDLFYDYVEEGQMHGGKIKQKNFDFNLVIPRFRDAALVQLLDSQNNIIQSQNISDYAQ
jgi:hypothetical protein